PQREHRSKTLAVSVRDIWPGGSLKRDRHIKHGVIRVRALVDSGGIDVGLERRSHLAQRLGCSVELRQIEIAAADHGFNFTAGVVNGDERALRARILLKTD